MNKEFLKAAMSAAVETGCHFGAYLSGILVYDSVIFVNRNKGNPDLEKWIVDNLVLANYSDTPKH